MILSAKVLHNVSADTFEGYRPETSRLFHAHEFQIVADSTEQACELVWTLTNVDDANHLASIRADLSLYGPQVSEYRVRRNRSLSVGDVVVFHEHNGDRSRHVATFTVLTFGWRRVERRVAYTDGTTQSEVSESYLAHSRRRRRP